MSSFYFDDSEHVEQYLKMADGFDGRDLIRKLKKYLPENATVLELGMGPGKDLNILAETYQVTGSDLSGVFLDLYRKEHPDADLLLLDAVNLDTDRRFDCIYSNKVLHHLSSHELKLSLNRQLDLLNPGGIAFHSFWLGDKEEMFDSLRFVYYTKVSIKPLIPDSFELLAFGIYKEFEPDDSFTMILRKK